MTYGSDLVARIHGPEGDEALAVQIDKLIYEQVDDMRRRCAETVGVCEGVTFGIEITPIFTSAAERVEYAAIKQDLLDQQAAERKRRKGLPPKPYEPWSKVFAEGNLEIGFPERDVSVVRWVGDWDVTMTASVFYACLQDLFDSPEMMDVAFDVLREATAARLVAVNGCVFDSNLMGHVLPTPTLSISFPDAVSASPA